MGIERQKTLARFRKERPKLEPVAKLDYEMAGIFDSKFRLSRKGVDEAYRRIMAHAESLADQYGEELGEAKSLAECLDTLEIDATFDQAGNLVKIGWDADADSSAVLELISDLVRDGSYFLLLDESDGYWKIAFESGRLRYYRQILEKAWLPMIRAQAKLVVETLQAAGWRLDAKKMAQKKKDLTAHRGSAELDSIDVECPVTVLQYPSGKLEMEVRYFGKAKAQWLYLDLNARKGNRREGYLHMQFTFKDRLDKLLKDIVAVQDTLSPEAWETWFRRHRRKYKTLVSGAAGIFKEAFFA